MDDAHRQIAERQFPEATKTLREIVAQAKEPEVRAEAQFALALATHDQVGSSVGDRDTPSQEASHSAVAEWERYNELDPNSLVGRNNLAMAKADAGDVESAKNVLESVVGSANDHVDEPYFRRNLARLYARSRDRRGAAREYTRVLQKAPHDSSVISELIELHVEHDLVDGVDGEELLADIRTNAPAAELGVASELLRRSRAASDIESATTHVALALASEIERRGVESASAKLSTVPVAMPADARGELGRLMTGSRITSRYWQERGKRQGRGRAYIRFVQALGSNALRNDAAEEAVSWYRVAASAAQGDDPETITPLVDLYVARPSSINELDPVMDAFFKKTKGRLPSTEAAYALHSAAGVAYAEAGRWDSARPHRGAIFHLQRATEIGAVIKKADAGLSAYLTEARQAVQASKRDPTAVQSATQPVTAQKDTEIQVGKGVNRVGSRSIRFAFDSHDLNCDTTTPILAFLNSNVSANLAIEGHSDHVGSDEYNQALGLRRAEAVIGCISKSGIARSRMRAVSYGETRPLDPNDTAQARQQNRRVEWVIDSLRP